MIDWENFKHAIPFIGAVIRGDDRGSPLFTRIIEQSMLGIIAGAGAAFLTLYINDAVRSADMTALQQRVAHIETQLDINYQHLDAKLDVMRDQLYVPRSGSVTTTTTHTNRGDGQ